MAITDIGITYVQLATSVGLRSIPNSQVLNAVVGPLPPPEPEPAAQPTVPLAVRIVGPPAADTQPMDTHTADTQTADTQPGAGNAGSPPGAPA